MDQHGCPVPAKLGLFPLLRVAVRAGVPLRIVPEDYWRAASDVATHHLQAYVSCVCGQTNTMTVGVELLSCPGCDRWFFYTGTEVLVFNPA